MAYKLSFGDGDADAAFWERLSGYCVQIISPDGAGADYEVVGGTTWNEELGHRTRRPDGRAVRAWTDGRRGGARLLRLTPQPGHLVEVSGLGYATPASSRGRAIRCGDL